MSKLRLQDLVISSGGTASNELGFNDLRFVDALTIHAPDTLPETVTIEVTYQDDRNTTVNDWRDLEDAGAPITLTAGQSITISPVGFVGLRLLAGGAVAADRTFPVTGEDAGT